MDEESQHLSLTRRRLNTVLADQAPAYFHQLKQWFRMKTSKEYFDFEARKLLTPEQIHYHNEFLLALLNKVGGLAETESSVAHERALSHGINIRKPRSSTAPIDPEEAEFGFDPVYLGDYLPPRSPQGAGSDGVKYVAQEVFLPDHALVVGRFMLAAWDNDLEGVEDDAANCVVVATQIMLKNVLTAIITSMKPYKTKPNSVFKHDIGGDVPNMWLRNAPDDPMSVLKRQYGPFHLGVAAFGSWEAYTSATGYHKPIEEEMQQTAAMEGACSAPKEPEEEEEKVMTQMTVYDVYTAFRANRNIIGSHSVYSVNMERIANMLSHPST